MSSVWQVFRCSATFLAKQDSLKPFSSKPIVNVRTCELLTCCMYETMREESMPPDRNAPKGTSAIIRSRTERRRIVSKRSQVSSSEAASSRLLNKSLMWCCASQYFEIKADGSEESRKETVRRDPGASLQTPS